MSRHREALFHFALRYLRDETAAYDVVQETFVRVYFGVGKFKPKAKVKTWIFAIAVNLCRDQLRRHQKRRKEISLDASYPQAGQLVDPEPQPDRHATQMEQTSKLRRAIDQLPLALREPLILFCLEQRSQKEAAAILGTTPKTIELRVYRAKAKLRKWLENSFEE